MKLINQKNFFLLFLIIFIKSHLTQCMDNILLTKVLDKTSKKRPYQEIKSHPLTEEKSSTEDLSKESSSERSSVEEPPHKKQKINISEKKNDASTTKPYKCDYCDKTFQWKSTCKNHMIIHLEARPFQCNHKGCNKTFKTKYALKAHIDSIHKNNIFYFCNHNNCNKTFKHRGDLNRHIQAVHKEIRYQCSQCNKYYSTKGSLTNHIKNQHKKRNNR